MTEQSTMIVKSNYFTKSTTFYTTFASLIRDNDMMTRLIHFFKNDTLWKLFKLIAYFVNSRKLKT